jgi:hypothetical protein
MRAALLTHDDNGWGAADKKRIRLPDRMRLDPACKG